MSSYDIIGDGTGRTYRQHHLGSDDVPVVEIATDDLANVDIYPLVAVPVFVGHYQLGCGSLRNARGHQNKSCSC